MHSIYNRNELSKSDNLDNYYYFDEIFSEEEINKILNIAEQIPQQQGIISDNTIDTSYRTSTIKWLSLNSDTKWLYDKLALLARTANKNTWNFNLIGFGENIQIAEYNSDTKGHYDWHMDLGENSSFRKLSISVQLSDPSEYDGGELHFLTGRNSKKAPLKKGTAILFPSYLLHKVTPTTRGVRKSLVVWISGQPFK